MRLGELLAVVAAQARLVRGAANAHAGVPALRNGDGQPVATLPGDIATTRVCDITEDSRTVVPGSLFIARKGLKSDGRAFVQHAVKSGAAAILTDDATLTTSAAGVPVLHADDALLASALLGEAFYGGASRALDVVGVTGTNGKTTTTFLLWQLLNASGVDAGPKTASLRCGLIGTVMIDDGVEVARAMMTTPPAIEISRTLARMHECGCRAATMEVSSHALDQKRVDALRIRIGIFTNLTGDHLDYHGTMERYAAAKARLFELLDDQGVALVNAQDSWSKRMVQHCGAQIKTLAVVTGAGSTISADYECRVLHQAMDGMDLQLVGPFGTLDVRCGLVGKFNAFNVLAAVAAAHELGVPAAQLRAGVSALRAPPGRLERVTQPGERITVFVDYAHSDDSLRSVLSAVAGVMPGRHAGTRLDAAGSTQCGVSPDRLFVVFGCGGNRDTTKRPRMGAAAAEIADVVVITSDNPRTERPSDIVDQVLAGVPAAARSRTRVQIDRARAIELAIREASCSGGADVVVIAGKGHETEQILPDGSGGTISTHFDDFEVARAILASVGVRVQQRVGLSSDLARRKSSPTHAAVNTPPDGPSDASAPRSDPHRRKGPP